MSMRRACPAVRRAEPLTAGLPLKLTPLGPSAKILFVPTLDFTKLKTYPAGSRKSKVRFDAFAKSGRKGGTFRQFYDSFPNILAAKEFRGIVDAIVAAHAFWLGPGIEESGRALDIAERSRAPAAAGRMGFYHGAYVVSDMVKAALLILGLWITSRGYERY